MRRLSEDIDQLFNQFLGSGGASGRSMMNVPLTLSQAVQWIPPIEMFERDDRLVIQAELPGLGVDDVSVEVADGLVTISGERREQREDDGGRFRRTERLYGRFSRSIALPEGVRAEDVQATFRDGMLELTMPLPQQSQRRAVQIQSESRSQQAASGNGETATDDSRTSGGASPGKTAGEHATVRDRATSN
jgi:HSP20 family protein